MRNKLKKSVLHLAVPAALKHLLDIAQMLIDMLMVGFISFQAVAAVGISMQFMMMVNVLMTLYVVGSNAMISRLIGQRRIHRASSLLYTTALFAIMFSVPVSIVGNIYSSDFYMWMGASAEIVKEGGTYFGVITTFIVVLFLDNLLFNALSAAGDTKSSLYIKIISALLNLCLNYILIFGHAGFEARGIEGAAIATILAYTFNVLAYLFLFYRQNIPLHVIPRINTIDFIKALHIGYPAAIERFISSTSFLLFVSIITSYGSFSIAGYQIGLRIEGLAFMPGFGFAVASMALVGQSLGAKNSDLAYDSAKLSAQYAMMFMGSMGVMMFIFSQELASLFTKDIQTIEEASLYLKLVGISQIPLALVFVLSASLRGAGATKITLKVNVLSLWLLRVIPSYIAHKLGYSILAIYIIMTIETFIKGGVFWYLFQKKAWLHVKL